MINNYDITKTILVVDDDPSNLSLLKAILKDTYKVYAAPSGKMALSFLENRIPDLILLDLEMPHMNGYDVIKVIKGNQRWNDIPVVFITAQEGRDKEQEAFALGATDYISKPISAGVVRSRIALHIQLVSYKKNLEKLVEIKTSNLLRTQDAILNILANMTSFRDSETGAHIKRTTFFVEALVNNLIKKNDPNYIISPDYAVNIIKSAKLHDIGKVHIPDGILLKRGKLTQEEFEVIKKHTLYGARILDTAIEDIGDTPDFLKAAKEIVIGHHEKWDGTGYPHNLSGTQIPLSARIMAIADVYDALNSERPYKESFGHEKSIEIIFNDTGTHFDPYLIELSKDVFPDFEEISKKYSDSYSSLL